MRPDALQSLSAADKWVRINYGYFRWEWGDGRSQEYGCRPFRELCRRGPDEKGNTLFSYAHPFFWAPYSLIGDGG